MNSASAPATTRVVHLVGPVTDEVFSFLGPATLALAESGVAQAVVLVDDLRFRHLLPQFHRSVELVLTPAARNPARRWQWAAEALREAVVAAPTQVVQLHGALPCLVGAWVARRMPKAVALHYSPQGSASLGPAAPGALLRWILRRDRPEAASSVDARSSGSAGRVERPIEMVFFEMPRSEAPRPLVVAGTHLNNPRGTELLAQLAVLLGGEHDLNVAFHWLGSVDRGSAVRLRAANVSLFQVMTASERADHLAPGWVYLAPGGDTGFPSMLVEAMAAGLPCVALDTPEHRDVIRHGTTGFLCSTDRQFVQCIAQLLDSANFRRQIGSAARSVAERRFGQARFRDALFAAYDLSLDRPRAS
jgi:glycosyltransferase involved in cell wall biosynthesis